LFGCQLFMLLNRWVFCLATNVVVVILNICVVNTLKQEHNKKNH
jgi:hypothetical protein